MTLLGFIVFLKKRASITLFLFFAVWFIVGLSLHLQLIPLDFTVSDRWFYFPIIGLLGMFCTVANVIYVHNKRTLWIYAIIIILITFVFGIRDGIRNANWKNDVSLYKHDIQYLSNDYIIQLAYALELSNNGNQKEALAHILDSIRLHPVSQNWAILGFIYARSNKIKEAENSLTTALSYDNMDYFANETLAKIMVINNNPESTVYFLKKFLTKYPNDAMAWLYLSIENYKLGRKDDALLYVRKSYEIYPSQESAYVYEKIKNNQPVNLINRM